MTTLLAPGTTTSLGDLPAATSAYLHDQVEVEVVRVTANLQPGEDGTFTVRWTNAAAPTGIRLTDVTLHLVLDPGPKARLKVPGSAILQPRLTADLSAPRPPTDSLESELWIFLPDPPAVSAPFNSTLDVGEVAELELGYQALARGDVTFEAHIHATVDPADLFPRGRGADGTRVVTVRS